MNRQRRAELARAVSMIESAAAIVERAMNEEQDCLDNLPESIADSDRGERMERAVGCLEEAQSLLEEAVSEIREALI